MAPLAALQVLAEPRRLAILDPAEAHQILCEWNPPRAAFPSALLVHQAHVEPGDCVACSGRASVPPHCFEAVLAHAAPLGEVHAKVDLRKDIAGSGRTQ